jgi:hypothetical protein
MAGNKNHMFMRASWKNLIISFLLSTIITAAVYFGLLQPPNFISKRYIAAAILLWVVLTAGTFFLLPRFKQKITSIDQQVYGITMLMSLIAAFLLGYFVIGIENIPYNLFVLPKHSLVIENASENENDVIELIYLNSGLGDESFSKFIMNGSWTRGESSLITRGPQKASLYFEGWLVEKPVLIFHAQPNGGRVNIYWDGQLEQVSLYSFLPYQKQVTTTIDNPIFNKPPVFITCVLAIAITLFPLILLLWKKNYIPPRSIMVLAENPMQRKKIMGRTIASILTIAACIILVGLIILLFSTKEAPPLDVISLTNKFRYSVNFFRPETSENLIFTISTLTLPFLCAGFYLLFDHLLQRFKGNVRIYHLLITLTASVCVISLTVAGFLNAKIYLAASSLVQRPLFTLAFCATIFMAIMVSTRFLRRKWPSVSLLFENMYYFVGIILVVLLAMGTIFNERDPSIYRGHFIIYFDPVVQVYLGKTLLVNDTSTYGLYALLLKPIFQLIGLSVFKFTLVMGILKSVAFISLLSLLRSATKNRWIAFTGFTSIVFFICLRDPLNLANDPYFQYNPHRLFFPAVFILLFWNYICEKKKNRRKVLYLLTSLFSALSILWNPDTGLVVLATWLICLVYTEMLLIKKHKISEVIVNSIKHSAIVSIAIILTFMGFSLITYYSSGAWPELSDLLAYPKLYSEVGFHLLTIEQIIHPWNLFVIVYVTGVFIGARNFLESSHLVTPPPTLREGEKETNTLILAISILGIGLFYYYIGRSYDTNLIGPSWPVFLLLAIYTDRLFMDLSQISGGNSYKNAIKKYLRSPRIYYKVVLFTTLFCFLTSSLVNITNNLPSYWDLIFARKSGILDGIPSKLIGKTEFIKTNSHQGDQILILSNLAPELYLYTNTPRPLPVPEFVEIVLKSDMEIVTDFLRMPPMNAKIFWNPTFLTIEPTQFPNSLSLCASGDGLLLYCKK